MYYVYIADNLMQEEIYVLLLVLSCSTLSDPATSTARSLLA